MGRGTGQAAESARPPDLTRPRNPDAPGAAVTRPASRRGAGRRSRWLRTGRLSSSPPTPAGFHAGDACKSISAVQFAGFDADILGTDSLQTHRWREMDSNLQYRAVKGKFVPSAGGSSRLQSRMWGRENRCSQVREAVISFPNHSALLGAPPLRNQKFADSPVEGDGLELSVPRQESPGFP